MTTEEFVMRVLRATSFWREDLWWRCDGEYAPVTFLVNCNDLFCWACADAERVTEENLPLLEQAVIDAKAVGAESWWNVLFACRSRKMRPQGAYYEHLKPELAALIDAAGPERELTDEELKPELAALIDAAGPERELTDEELKRIGSPEFLRKLREGADYPECSAAKARALYNAGVNAGRASRELEVAELRREHEETAALADLRDAFAYDGPVRSLPQAVEEDRAELRTEVESLRAELAAAKAENKRLRTIIETAPPEVKAAALRLRYCMSELTPPTSDECDGHPGTCDCSDHENRRAAERSHADSAPDEPHEINGCDHKFVDSKACLKCGWGPPPRRKPIEHTVGEGDKEQE